MIALASQVVPTLDWFIYALGHLVHCLTLFHAVSHSFINTLASISTVVQMTPFRFEPPARILDRRDLRLLCFHLR